MNDNHIIISDKSSCSGCSACATVCGTDAITMTEDKKGFFYPSVDEQKCVNCGKCTAVCPFGSNNRNESGRLFAVRNLDEKIRMRSSSGGVFSALAEDMTETGGVVYGAAFDENFRVVHERADDEKWIKFCGSKYVQSDIRGIFSQLRDDLKNGRSVLFTGTPCQVAGAVNATAGCDRSRLLTCDIICHGVPSPKVWKNYLDHIKGNKKISSVSFRYKKNSGWHDSILHIEDDSGNTIVEGDKPSNLFFQLFFNHYILRPSCYKCPFANFKRSGDLTIGDLWGIEKHYPELDDNKGTSLVAVNSDKGMEQLERLREKCEITAVEREKCLQPNLVAPAQPFGDLDEFWLPYEKHGFTYACKNVGLMERSFLEKIYFRIAKKLS